MLFWCLQIWIDTKITESAGARWVVFFRYFKKRKESKYFILVGEFFSFTLHRISGEDSADNSAKIKNNFSENKTPYTILFQSFQLSETNKFLLELVCISYRLLKVKRLKTVCLVESHGRNTIFVANVVFPQIFSRNSTL